MSRILQDRVALVTGAGRGLGRHVAVGLARAGARVALTSRSVDQLGETARLIASDGGAAFYLPADISKPGDVGQLREHVEREMGPPDVLVNAAGVFGPIQLIRGSDPQQWIDTLLTNTVGPYLVCRALVDAMIDRGWGRIVNFSSAATLHPPGPLNSAYGTSKVALNQFTRHLAAELDGTGVTANVIHPGEVKTAMWAKIQDDARQAGPVAQAYQNWADSVGESGGDDPQKALDLILELIDGSLSTTNGQFHWIRDGLQSPIPSW